MKNPRQHSHPTAGFTLIEVVLAALVLVAGLIGVIQVISSGTDMLDVSRKQAIAARIIHSEIDKLRLYDWTRISSFPLFPSPPLSNTETAVMDLLRDPTGRILFYDGPIGSTPATTVDKLKIIDVGISIDPSFTCTRMTEDVRTGLKKITFTVTWRNTKDSAHPHSRSGFTYFGQNGLYVAFQRS